MKVIADKRLFWFLKDNQELDLADSSVLDMFVQQVLSAGLSKDVHFLLEDVGIAKFRESFERIKAFISRDVRRYWEDYFGGN